MNRTVIKSVAAFPILLGVVCTPATGQTRIERLMAQAAPPMTQIEAKSDNGITYMCGGVGKEEAQAMKRAALEYDLMLTFVSASGAYLADVNVDIIDASGQPLVQTACGAPIMLIDFPQDGAYRLRAETGGHTITRVVQVRAGSKAEKLAMAWPTKIVEREDAPRMHGGAGDRSSFGSSSMPDDPTRSGHGRERSP